MDGKKMANLWDQSCCLMEQMLHLRKYCRWLDVNVLRHNVRQIDVVVSKLELTALNFVDVKIVKTKKIWKRVNLKMKMMWSITKKKTLLMFDHPLIFCWNTMFWKILKTLICFYFFENRFLIGLFRQKLYISAKTTGFSAITFYFHWRKQNPTTFL